MFTFEVLPLIMFIMKEHIFKKKVICAFYRSYLVISKDFSSEKCMGKVLTMPMMPLKWVNLNLAITLLEYVFLISII